MKYCAFVVSIFVVYYISPAFSIGWGECKHELSEKDNDYKLDQLVGSWYENATHSMALHGIHGKCTTVTISKVSDDVHSIAIDKVFGGQKAQFLGKIDRTKVVKSGKYTYDMTLSKDKNAELPESIKVDFALVDTDYKCWAVVYFCYKTVAIHFDDVSVLLKSRDSTCMNEATAKEVHSVLTKNKEKFKLFYIEHDDTCSA